MKHVTLIGMLAVVLVAALAVPAQAAFDQYTYTAVPDFGVPTSILGVRDVKIDDHDNIGMGTGGNHQVLIWNFSSLTETVLASPGGKQIKEVFSQTG